MSSIVMTFTFTPTVATGDFSSVTWSKDGQQQSGTCVANVGDTVGVTISSSDGSVNALSQGFIIVSSRKGNGKASKASPFNGQNGKMQTGWLITPGSLASYNTQLGTVQSSSNGAYEVTVSATLSCGTYADDPEMEIGSLTGVEPEYSSAGAS